MADVLVILLERVALAHGGTAARRSRAAGALQPAWQAVGRDGMGQASLGGHLPAIKAIHGELAGDHEFRAPFSREVAGVRRVNGRITAQLVDADTEGPMVWLATVYVAGASVADYKRLTLNLVGCYRVWSGIVAGWHNVADDNAVGPCSQLAVMIPRPSRSSGSNGCLIDNRPEPHLSHPYLDSCETGSVSSHVFS